MNIELGIGIGGGSLFAPTSNDQLVAYAWASALSPNISTSSVVHNTVSSVPANSAVSALVPTISSAGNATILSVTANANGSALMPSVAIAGSVSVNAVVASSNLDSMIPTVSTIRNVSVSGVVADSTASAIIPTVSTSGVSPTILVQDSFTRSDNTTSLGLAETGQTWQKYGTAIFGILNNQVYLSTVANDAFNFVDVLNTDVKISINVPVSSTGEPGIYFRVVDSTNYLRAVRSGGSIYLQKRSGAGNTSIASKAVAYTSNEKITVVAKTVGNIDVYINDVLQISTTDTTHATSTKHGFGCGSGHSNTRWDNLLIESL